MAEVENFCFGVHVVFGNLVFYYLTILVYVLAVVNLTLIDLPGLTKVAVGILSAPLLKSILFSFIY